MLSKVSEKEIAEFMGIAYELCAKYGIDPNIVTREGAIEQILKDRPMKRKMKKYMRTMGKAIAIKVDSDIVNLLRGAY